MKSSAETYDTTQLFLDDSERGSTQITVELGQTLVKNQVVAVKTATGEVVEHNPAATDGSQKATYIMPYDVDATSAAVKGSAYNKGGFNQDALVWHANVNTDALKSGAFSGTPINVGKLK